MLRYIKTLLEVDDHRVETASTGEEALEKVQKGLTPDLVLLDLLMPGIDGLETLESLRKLHPGTKVVMLSCVNDTKKVVQAIRLGATDYITKPFQKAELDAVIDQCLGTNQQNYRGPRLLHQMDGDQHGLVVCRAKLPGRVPQTRGATLDLVSPGRSPGRGCRYPVPGRHPRRHPTCALI